MSRVERARFLSNQGLNWKGGETVRDWVIARRGGLVPTTRIKDEAEELGQLGPIALKMMVDVFTSLIHKFPAVGQRESVEDAVNGFFADKGRGYVVAVLAAADDIAARKVTYTWGIRWLVDEARKLPFGALRNRLEKRLERSALFSPSRVAHHWYLADGEDESLPATTSQLEDIAADAGFEATPRTDGGVQLGKAGDLEALIGRLLAVAGRLHVSEIAVICGKRFPATLLVGDASASTADRDWEVLEDTTEGADLVFATALKIRAERTAVSMMKQLTPEEVIVIRHRENIPRLTDELGCSRSSAYKAVERVRARLVQLAGEGPEARQALLALMRLILDDSAVVPSHHNDRKDARAI